MSVVTNEDADIIRSYRSEFGRPEPARYIKIKDKPKFHLIRLDRHTDSNLVRFVYSGDIDTCLNVCKRTNPDAMVFSSVVLPYEFTHVFEKLVLTKKDHSLGDGNYRVDDFAVTLNRMNRVRKMYEE
jgi:hypothetical protein